MQKTASTVGPINKNSKQSGQEIQVKDQGEKKPAQKCRNSQKSQKIAKSKKWIHTKKIEASKAKNLG